MQQVIQNEDLVKKIRSFDKYTYWYHKEIFDRIIKEIDVKTKMYYQISEACLEAINDMFKEIENDSKGINSVYYGYVDTHARVGVDTIGGTDGIPFFARAWNLNEF